MYVIRQRGEPTMKTYIKLSAALLAVLLAMVFWWVGRLWRRGQLKAG